MRKWLGYNMNLRKFYLVISVIIAVFLFIAGIVVVYFLNSGYINANLAVDSENPISRFFQPFSQSREPFNVLVLGGDKVNNNSDTMMLVNFDPVTYKVNIMSIPRDTKVVIDNKDRKINYAYPHGGIDLAVQTVSDLLDVKIKYYTFVDTVAFSKIIDLLGGVDYYIPANMDYDDPTQNLHIHLKKGQQTLDGAQSEEFIRFRDPNHWTAEIKKYYDGSDLKRIEAQQNFMKELIRQKFNIQYLPKLNSIISVMFENIDTNFTLSEIFKFTGYIGKFDSSDLNFIALPGQPFDGTPWYFICDQDKAREITVQNFKCNYELVQVDDSVKKTVNNNSNNKSESVKSKPKAASSPKKSVTKNNPSNADSSLKGDQKPAP
jgi:polyisoprenyl-teichoic acid--peptidoglycan teichoic acid transferase